MQMSRSECSCCRRQADVRSFRRCCDCGALLCDDCASRYNGLCSECSDDDRTY